jgi:hypothetical protein
MKTGLVFHRKQSSGRTLGQKRDNRLAPCKQLATSASAVLPASFALFVIVIPEIASARAHVINP